jgi:hypothetical protein
MFSFKQLYEFNNLHLNKSFLRKRTRHAEEDIASLQDQVKVLQAWREDIEMRTDKRFAEVTARFERTDLRNQD